MQVTQLSIWQCSHNTLVYGVLGIMSSDLRLRGTLHVGTSVDVILSVGKCLPQNLIFGWTYKLVGGYGETKLF